MKDSIVLTQQEANSIMDILGGLPIRHLDVVQAVQRLLQEKFISTDTPTDIPVGVGTP